MYAKQKNVKLDDVEHDILSIEWCLEHVEKGERKHLPIMVIKCHVIVISFLDQKTPRLIIDLSNKPIVL